MIDRIREKLLAFIHSEKDVPLLAGFSVGFYVLLFYYSRNFSLANSPGQILFFIAYYILLPMAVLFAGCRLLGAAGLGRFRRHFLFTGMLGLFLFFMLQLNSIGYGLSKKIIFAIALSTFALLSIWLRKYYKLFVVLLLFISVFNIKPLAELAWKFVNASSEWKKQPDAIGSITFTARPNIYYIQPDGFTSFRNFRENSHYPMDISAYETFLRQNGFTLYDSYRSNYISTLLSNAATFSMKHHYIARDVEAYGCRDIIAGDNPVLRILKKNGYTANFITETPYIIMNRPRLGYDYCNIAYSDIPFLGDGFSRGIRRNVEQDLKDRMKQSTASGNFYFVEKFLPEHIPTYPAQSEGAETEARQYLGRTKESMQWLRDIVAYITAADPRAVIIIGADHGGFAGFASSKECLAATRDEALVNSIFGAHLAIRWNDPGHARYDAGLHSGINLFRTVFAFLAQDVRYLEHLQDDSSYIGLEHPEGIYKYIDDSGKVVLERYE